LQTAARAAKERIYGKKAEKAVKDAAQAVYQKHGSRNPAREGVQRRKRTSAVKVASVETAKRARQPAPDDLQMQLEL
jgi:hypothetical protein